MPIAVASMIAKEFVRTLFYNFMFLPVYFVVIYIIRIQYQETMDIDINTYGPFCKDIGELIKETVFYGFVIGFVLNLVITGIGIPINTQGFGYLFYIIVFLALVNIRYVSFTNAAGLLALISLAFPKLQVDISTLLVLAGMMNLLESILIYLNAGRESVPVFIKHPQGIVGAFLIRRYWPVPLLLLSFSITGNGPGLNGNFMPHWWPLFKPGNLAVGAVAFSLDCSVAVLGYSDVIITQLPERKARKTAILFFVNSLVVLMLACISHLQPVFKVLGVVMSLVGHEAVVLYTNYIEKKGDPMFKSENRGLRVLEVMPESAADFMGMQRGDVILNINGRDIQTDGGMLDALKDFPTFVWVTVRQINGHEKVYEYKNYPGGINQLGVLTVPREKEVTYNVDRMENFGILKNLVLRFKGFNKPV